MTTVWRLSAKTTIGELSNEQSFELVVFMELSWFVIRVNVK